MLRFLIYVEGGIGVCIGHIMRMLTLAEALTETKVQVYFASSTEEGILYLNRAGYEVVKMDELDYYRIVNICKNLIIDGVIVDRFGFTTEQHQLLVDQVGYLVHIDDFLYNGPANLVINTTIDGSPTTKGYQSKWLCGGDYALIRKQFSRNSVKSHKIKPCKLLLTTGYCDPINFHLRIIRIVNQLYPEMEIHLVVGGGFSTMKELEKIKRSANLILHREVLDMSDLMFECDMAISAGGTTLYELAASGIPTIAISLYDNQIDNLRRVAERGCAISLGWHAQVTDYKIEEAIRQVYTNSILRKNLSEKSTTWIDGKGANRIATQIYNDLLKKKAGD